MRTREKAAEPAVKPPIAGVRPKKGPFRASTLGRDGVNAVVLVGEGVGLRFPAGGGFLRGRPGCGGDGLGPSQ